MDDVIIVGGGFAGLAVASQLKGFNVLLLARKPIGSGQTSACGTVLSALERWDVQWFDRGGHPSRIILR